VTASQQDRHVATAIAALCYASREQKYNMGYMLLLTSSHLNKNVNKDNNSFQHRMTGTLLKKVDELFEQ